MWTVLVVLDKRHYIVLHGYVPGDTTSYPIFNNYPAKSRGISPDT